MQALRADKRWEALVKKQETEHQHIIASHHKEMQTLRDSLSLAMERFTSLFERNEKDFMDFKMQATSDINGLKKRIMENELTINMQKKTIEGLHQQLLNFQSVYSSKADAEKYKGELDDKITKVIMSHIISFQDCQREFKSLFNSLRDDLEKLRSLMEQKVAEAREKSESNFSIAKIDRDGVLKELTRYKKAVFYIEKKIENIYTLIERINKKGEASSCLKQEL